MGWAIFRLRKFEEHRFETDAEFRSGPRDSAGGTG